MILANEEMGIEFEVDNEADFNKWYAKRKEQIRADAIDDCIKFVDEWDSVIADALAKNIKEQK